MACFVETIQVRTTTIHHTTIEVIAVLDTDTDEPAHFELITTYGTNLTDGFTLTNEPTDNEIASILADAYVRAA